MFSTQQQMFNVHEQPAAISPAPPAAAYDYTASASGASGAGSGANAGIPIFTWLYSQPLYVRVLIGVVIMGTFLGIMWFGLQKTDRDVLGPDYEQYKSHKQYLR